MHALTCHISRDGLNTVVVLVGELDIATRRLLTALASPCIAHGASLTLDCAQVTFLDSQGLNALLELRRATIGSGAVLLLASPSQAVTRQLSMSGLAAFFTTTGRRTAVPGRDM
jgi:anti-sigma B factor antagonist